MIQQSVHIIFIFMVDHPVVHKKDCSYSWDWPNQRSGDERGNIFTFIWDWTCDSSYKCQPTPLQVIYYIQSSHILKGSEMFLRFRIWPKGHQMKNTDLISIEPKADPCLALSFTPSISHCTCWVCSRWIHATSSKVTQTFPLISIIH